MPDPDVKLISTDPPPPQINGVPGPISLPKITPPVPAPSPASAPPPPATIKPSPQMSGQTGYGVKTMIPPIDPYDKAEMPKPPLAPMPAEKFPNEAVKASIPLNPALTLPPKPPAIKSYSYKPKTNSSRGILIVLVIFLLLALIGFGVFYFIKKFNTPASNNDLTPSLNLTPDQTALNNVNQSTKAAEFKKPNIAPDKGFGVLPPVDLSAFLLKDLKLKGTVIANEAPSGNFASKTLVYLKINDPSLASSSAFFAKDYLVSTISAQNLNESDFLKRVDNQQSSSYSTLNESQALGNLVSSNAFYGSASPQIDWSKYILKSWQINNATLAYYYSNSPSDKYVLPIYVFDGKAKLRGLVDGRLMDVTLKLFTLALSD